MHTLQYLTQTSPAMTVLSVDGVGAYDHVSRLAMLQALRDTPDACRVLPYVRLWYSTPSTYVWIDGNNCPHRVTQAEGGEQGDPFLPALFSLGMQRALTALQTELQPGERVLAFLDDLYIVAAPERVRTLFDAVARRLYEEVRIYLNHAKTRVWNAAAVEPPGLDTLAPDGTAWCGAEASPAEERGITVLGAPLGTDAYVQTQLTAVSDRQLRFLQVLPTLPDLQVAWLLLLYCASPRSNYALRMLPPNLTAGFASASDQAVQQCLYSLLNADNSGHLPQQAACLAQIALRHGGLGLRSAQLHAPAAFWASWADALPAVHRRDPELAAILSQQLAVPGACASLVAVQAAVAHLVQCGFEAPTWPALLAQNGPRPPSVEDDSPGFGRGWQQTASAVLDLHFANECSSALDPASAAMLLSQSGPAAAQVFTMLPTCRELVVEPQHFRVLLLRRLRMPLPFSPARCSCGHMCDALGDHRSASRARRPTRTCSRQSVSGGWCHRQHAHVGKGPEHRQCPRRRPPHRSHCQWPALVERRSACHRHYPGVGFDIRSRPPTLPRSGGGGRAAPCSEDKRAHVSRADARQFQMPPCCACHRGGRAVEHRSR